jgi:cytochrome c oxidase subunit 2
VWALDDLVKRGEKVYAANCAACHQANGKGAGPIKALDGSPIVLGSYAEQMKSILDGRANGTMPAWKQLSDTDLAAVMTYTRNAWSNKTGQVIQPAMFLNARGGKFPDGGAMAGAAAAAPTAAVAPAPVAAAPTGMPYSIFFASGQSALDPEAQATLKAAADFLKANAAQKVVLSGFVDSTGNADQNAELAKKRAFAVRDALKAAGVDEARIDLQKPQAITAGQGSDREARRVEIKAAG